MKKALKIIAIILGSMAAFVVLYFAFAYTLSRIGVNKTQSEKGDIPVFILTNGVHTDIMVPVHTPVIDWSREIRFSNTRRKDTLAQWVAFGWGDKGFYLETPTWADLTFSTAFKAMFGLSHSAIHATFHDQLKEDERTRALYLSETQYKKLVGYIQESLQLDGQKMPVYINTSANYGNDDAFYEGTGSYSLFHTCNTWANNGLKACGQKACFWTPFDTGIFDQYPLQAPPK
ncbi:MAG: TIGR02117 family protein [Bacteroidota bacterium]